MHDSISSERFGPTILDTAWMDTPLSISIFKYTTVFMLPLVVIWTAFIVADSLLVLKTRWHHTVLHSHRPDNKEESLSGEGRFSFLVVIGSAQFFLSHGIASGMLCQIYDISRATPFSSSIGTACQRLYGLRYDHGCCSYDT